MIVYKALRVNGTSQYMGTYWPLPRDGAPGEWMDISDDDTPIGLCAWGLHGYLAEETAVAQGCSHVYEMELLDKDGGDDGILKDLEKACGHQARLLRLIRDENGPVITLAELVWQ